MGRQGRWRPPRCLLSAGALPLPATLCPFYFLFLPLFFFFSFLIFIFFRVLLGFLFFAPGVLRTLSRAVFGAGCAHPGQAFPLKVWRRWWMRGRDTLRRRLVEVLVKQLS